MENGPIWDIIANDIVRHERFRDIPANVQKLCANVGNRHAAKRRLRRFAILLQENKESKYTGCPKKTQKLLKSLMLTFECPSNC